MSKRIFTCLIIAVIALAAANGAYAEDLTDASGQWTYVLKGDMGSTFVSYHPARYGRQLCRAVRDGQ